MQIRYKNGSDVLTNNVLDQLREEGMGGCYIYIPINSAEEKDKLCIRAGYMRYEEGLKVKKIADQLHLKIRQIYLLLALFKERYPDRCI